MVNASNTYNKMLFLFKAISGYLLNYKKVL